MRHPRRAPAPLLVASLATLLAACPDSGGRAGRPLPAAPAPTASAPGPPVALEGEDRLAWDVLVGATRFTDDAIGYLGEVPREVLAWQRLDRHPRAAELFGDLAREATLAGQLYALAGLALHDRAAFEREESRLRAEKGVVEQQRGCVTYRDLSVAELLTHAGEAGPEELAPLFRRAGDGPDAPVRPIASGAGG